MSPAGGEKHIFIGLCADPISVVVGMAVFYVHNISLIDWQILIKLAWIYDWNMPSIC